MLINENNLQYLNSINNLTTNFFVNAIIIYRYFLHREGQNPKTKDGSAFLIIMQELREIIKRTIFKDCCFYVF